MLFSHPTHRRHSARSRLLTPYTLASPNSQSSPHCSVSRATENRMPSTAVYPYSHTLHTCVIQHAVVAAPHCCPSIITHTHTHTHTPKISSRAMCLKKIEHRHEEHMCQQTHDDVYLDVSRYTFGSTRTRLRSVATATSSNHQ